MEIELVEKLIHKELSGVISAPEQRKLSSWLADNEHNKAIYQEISTIWNLASVEHAEVPNLDLDSQLKKLQSNIEVKTNSKILSFPQAKSKPFPWSKLAAGIIFLVAVVALARVFNTDISKNLVESTNPGEIQTLEMVDGSTIVLNQTSEISFFPHIKNERRVNLRGEAFFQVARDESKPFIIETDNATISVLGTSFNVKTGVEQGTEIIVRSGKVLVVPKDGKQSKVLTKGQSVRLADEFIELQKREDILTAYPGFLNFKNANIESVFSKLELRFNREFLWDKSLLEACDFFGQLDDKSLEEILAILKTALNFDSFEILETHVNIIGGQCN